MGTRKRRKSENKNKTTKMKIDKNTERKTQYNLAK